MTDRSSKRLRAETIARAALTGADRAAMWALFSRYYASITRETFERDLDAKNDVIVLRDDHDDKIAGFSTIAVYDETVDGSRVRVVFSGDTVIDEAYWGQTALQRAFFLYLMRAKLTKPFRRVYWFLISKGYKTYLLLARNVPTHYPRHDAPTPALEDRVIDRLAKAKYPDAWNAEAGVLRFDDCPGRLKDGIAPIEAHLLEHDDIRFFLERNPGHARGDELCCLGAIDRHLPFFFIARQLAKALRRATRVARRLWAVTTTSF